MITKLASFIASHPRLVEMIIKIGKRNHYSQLYHSDGSFYMNRWWLMPRILLTRDENNNPYPRKWVPILVRLHHIQSEDWDRDLHDHPSAYRTIILLGSYVEEDIYGNEHTRMPGQTKTASAETFHRIKQVSQGGVWTIFIMRKKTNEWGFLVNGKKAPWRKYVFKERASDAVSA